MLDLFGDESRRHPHVLYQQLRGAPVHHDPRSDLWMILAYDAVQRALLDHETWSSRAAPRAASRSTG